MNKNITQVEYFNVYAYMYVRACWLPSLVWCCAPNPLINFGSCNTDVSVLKLKKWNATTTTAATTPDRLGKIIYMRLHLLHFSAELFCVPHSQTHIHTDARLCGFLQCCFNIKKPTTTKKININIDNKSPSRRIWKDLEKCKHVPHTPCWIRNCATRHVCQCQSVGRSHGWQ